MNPSCQNRSNKREHKSQTRDRNEKSDNVAKCPPPIFFCLRSCPKSQANRQSSGNRNNEPKEKSHHIEEQMSQRNLNLIHRSMKKGKNLHRFSKTISQICQSSNQPCRCCPNATTNNQGISSLQRNDADSTQWSDYSANNTGALDSYGHQNSNNNIDIIGKWAENAGKIFVDVFSNDPIDVSGEDGF